LILSLDGSCIDYVGGLLLIVAECWLKRKNCLHLQKLHFETSFIKIKLVCHGTTVTERLHDLG